MNLDARTKPGEWLEYSPLLTILVGALLCVYLVDLFRTSPQGALAALDLNTFNLIFITAGLLLQWRPKRFLRAVMDVIPGTAGVIIQFPLYAVIFVLPGGTVAVLLFTWFDYRRNDAAGGRAEVDEARPTAGAAAPVLRRERGVDRYCRERRRIT